MDNSKGSGGGQFGPVGSPAHPVQVVPQELVMRCPAVHQTIGDYCGCMTNGDPDSILGMLQDEGIRVVVPDQELEIQIYWLFS